MTTPLPPLDRSRPAAASPSKIPLVIAGMVLLCLLGAGAIAIRSMTHSVQNPEPIGPVLQGDAIRGKTLYMQNCQSCHGIKGQGAPGQGAPLVGSAFLKTNDDAHVVEMVRKGRTPDAPDTVMGLIMLPNGGNPALTQKDRYDIVAFIRKLDAPKSTTAPAQ